MYKRTMEVKEGKNWIETYSTTDEVDVLEWLVNDLISKYMFKSRTIKRIKELNNYDGTRTITVYYEGNQAARSVYIVKR